MNALVVALLLSTSPKAAEPSHSVQSGTISFQVVHKLHQIKGVSKAVEGKARVVDGSKLQVMVRARVDSFDSGSGNRDSHMLEAVEAEKFPYVELKGVADGYAVPAKFPAESKLLLRSELTFHGITAPMTIEATLRHEDAANVRVTANFPIKLTAFHIVRPALLLVKVEDQVEIAVDLSFRQEK